MIKINTAYLDTIQATNLLTLEEYIYVYPRLMSEYIKLGVDCNEMYFIEEQIEQHYLYIDIAKKNQKLILDDYDYKKYGTFEDWVKTVRSYDIVIVSLKSIIKFLETKKSELEVPQPPTPPEDDKSKEIPFIFKNTFDSVSEKKVYDYFKQNLVDKKYITQTDLHTFLVLAFENNNKPTEKISFIKTPIKKKVVSIFYSYFNLVAGKTYGRREDYLNLLRNHFIGFENYNIKNFSE